MNKKIIISLAVIGAVAAIAVTGTVAYFSDTETIQGNTFSAGIIDISIGESANIPAELSDLKPCETRYIEFDVRNDGTNPVVIWKHIGITDHSDDPVSEPECEAGGGTWNPTDKTCGGSYTPEDDIENAILYDMELTLNDEDPVVLIPEDWGITVGDIESLWIPLGTLQSGDVLHVKQSYHLAPDTGNWAQGDSITFNIDLYGEQRLGPGPGPTDHGVVLENKTCEPDWYSEIDGTWGLLTYTASSPTFDYNFRGFGLEPGQTYRLVYSEDPFSAFTQIDSGSANSDGELTLNGNVDLGKDLNGAKIWLLYGDSGWGPCDKTLWESNLIDYDDTNL